ncbi:hypothetical protein [Mycolicibacter sinensis]|uniref:Uncharacterized protein n=1 Tax=Mycolicibacter sinensis (strain JDM601) TaxID=875328 RepID=A0A1A3U967_MYCSD|nr:hypothetical protein [Mycolicibacter sinensis]OBK91485.1 hypothetical protein A5648_14075 [Mycolicibacter sinensis]
MTETPTPAPAEPVTPATEGLAGLLAAAAEQTLASMSAEAFAELVQRVRPPDEQPAAPVRPQGSPPPSRMPVVPSEPTPDQAAAMERYRQPSYPASWGFQREESK